MGLEILLHIGRHKSGTSSLQAYLNSQDLLHRAQGVVYPLAGRSLERHGRLTRQIAHHPLALSFLDKDQITARAYQQQVLSELRAELPRDCRVIFSSESFGNLIQAEQIERLQAFLGELKPDHVSVFAYVREFLDFISSGFRQRVQNSTDLFALSEYAPLRNRHYSLSNWLEAWSRVGTLVCRRFSRDALIDGDVIADFCLHAGLDLHHHLPRSEQNPSIGGNLLFLKCALNRLGRHHPSLYNLMGEQAALQPAYRRPFPISAADAEQIRAGSCWNITLEQLFGSFRMPTFAAMPPCPDLGTLEADLEQFGPLLSLVGTQPHELVALTRESCDWFTPFPNHQQP